LPRPLSVRFPPAARPGLSPSTATAKATFCANPLGNCVVGDEWWEPGHRFNLNTISTNWHSRVSRLQCDGQRGHRWRNDMARRYVVDYGEHEVRRAISTHFHRLHIGVGRRFTGDGKSVHRWRRDNGSTVLWEMNGDPKVATSISIPFRPTGVVHPPLRHCVGCEDRMPEFRDSA